MKLPYGPDDDDAADRFINNQLRNPNPAAWGALADDDYVLQTDRVLDRMREAISVAFANRNGEVSVAKARRLSGELSNSDFATLLAEYEDWKTRTLHFQSLVNQRRKAIVDRARKMRGDDVADALRKSLLTLAEAVADHRDRVNREYEPTDADRMLWVRLSVLRWPCKSADDTIPLDQAVVNNRRVAAS